jgi:hypothetical protein
MPKDRQETARLAEGIEMMLGDPDLLKAASLCLHRKIDVVPKGVTALFGKAMLEVQEDAETHAHLVITTASIGIFADAAFTETLRCCAIKDAKLNSYDSKVAFS